MSRIDRINPTSFRAVLVWLLGAGLAILLALVAAVQPSMGIAGIVVIAIAAGFSRSSTFAMCAFVFATYFEVITTITGNSALSPIKFTGGALILLAVLNLILRSRRGVASIRPAWSSHMVVVGSLIAFLIVATASVSWASSVEQVHVISQRIGTEVLIFLAFGVLLHTKRQFLALAWTTLIAGALSTIVGLLIGASLGGRLFGSFTDPNDYAAAMLVSIILGYVAIGAVPSRTLTRWLGTASIALCAYGLLMSQSRGGLIAVIAACGVVVLTSRERERMRMMGGSLVLVALAASFMVFTPNGQATLDRVTNGDSSGRSELWDIAQLQFRERPITGQGLGNFPVVAVRFITPKMRHTDLVTRAPRTTHNAYLEVAAELGLLGIATFGTFIGSCLVLITRGMRASRRLDDQGMVRIGRSMLATTVGLLVACVFLSGQYNEVLWVMLSGCVAFHAMVERQLKLAAALDTARLVIDGLPVEQLELEASEALVPAALADFAAS